MESVDTYRTATVWPRVWTAESAWQPDRHLLALGLVYATLISPFIGGVRGWPCTIGWLVAPAIFVWRTRDPGSLGLHLGGANRFRNLAIALLAGALCGFTFYKLSAWVPMLAQFTLALPTLHKNADYGNVRLFICLIPVGHFVHEVFYRGFLQTRLATRLQSPFSGILLGALLYGWTHVFIFSSLEFQTIMSGYVGARNLPDVSRTLAAVIAFSIVESFGSGAAIHLTKSVWPGIIFRVTNLVTVVLLVYPQFHLL